MQPYSFNPTSHNCRVLARCRREYELLLAGDNPRIQSFLPTISTDIKHNPTRPTSSQIHLNLQTSWQPFLVMWVQSKQKLNPLVSHAVVLTYDISFSAFESL